MHTFLWIYGDLEIEITVNEFVFLCLTVLRGYKDVIFQALVGFPLFSGLDGFYVGVIAK